VEIMLKVWFVCSLMLFAPFAMSAQPECIPKEVHITLGDKFSLEQTAPDHVFTVGFTLNSSCESVPKLGLVNKVGQNTTVADFIIVKEANMPLPDGFLYQRKGYFIRIKTADVEASTSWLLTGDNKETLAGPFAWPDRLLDDQRPLKIFSVADMDITNNSIPTIAKIKTLDSTEYDLMLHIGDFAYEIEDNSGKKGDDFFQTMSLTTAKLPYVITPGNHENFFKSQLFNYRFRMPNTDATPLRENHYFDCVVKGTYFMIVNFDYFYRLYDYPAASKLILDWMVRRIALLDKRSDINWKIFVSHRPFTCSDPYADDCKINFYLFRRFEDLLAKSGFHFNLQGHLHIYTRNKPLVGFTRFPVSKLGSGAMASIINGHAGTVHYYANKTEEPAIWGGFIDAVDASGPTYCDVEISKTRFQGKLIRSDNQQLRDSFFIDKIMLDAPNEGWWQHSVIVAVVVSAVLLVLFAIIARRYLAKPAHYDVEYSFIQTVSAGEKNSGEMNNKITTDEENGQP
jgi:hypothetical protein